MTGMNGMILSCWEKWYTMVPHLYQEIWSFTRLRLQDTYTTEFVAVLLESTINEYVLMLGHCFDLLHSSDLMHAQHNFD